MEDERGIEKAAEESMLFENLPQLPEEFDFDLIGGDIWDALLGAIPVLKYIKVGKEFMSVSQINYLQRSLSAFCMG